MAPKFPTAFARAAVLIRWRCASSNVETNALASGVTFLGGTRIAPSQSFSAAGNPPTLVATTGSPQAIASITALGMPSSHLQLNVSSIELQTAQYLNLNPHPGPQDEGKIAKKTAGHL